MDEAHEENDKKRREAASRGGKKAHAMGSAHKFTSEEAAIAGRKGIASTRAQGKEHRFTSEEAKAAGIKGREARKQKRMELAAKRAAILADLESLKEEEDVRTIDGPNSGGSIPGGIGVLSEGSPSPEPPRLGSELCPPDSEPGSNTPAIPS